jgi:hypothetical protein
MTTRPLRLVFIKIDLRAPVRVDVKKSSSKNTAVPPSQKYLGVLFEGL